MCGQGVYLFHKSHCRMEQEQVGENQCQDMLQKQVQQLIKELAESRQQQQQQQQQLQQLQQSLTTTPTRDSKQPESSASPAPTNPNESDEDAPDEEYDEDEEDAMQQRAAQSTGVIEALAGNDENIVDDSVIIFKNLNTQEKDDVANLLKDTFQTNSEENLRDPIHEKLVPIVRSWLFDKPKQDDLKKLMKQKRASNASFLDSLFINIEVFQGLSEKPRFLDRAARSNTNSLLAALKPLTSALDAILNVEACTPKNQQGLKNITCKDDTVNVTQLREDISNSLQLAGVLYFQLNVRRKQILRPYLSREFQLLTTNITKFDDKWLFGSNIQDQLAKLSRLSRISNKARRGGNRTPRRIKPYRKGRYQPQASKNYQRQGWSQPWNQNRNSYQHQHVQQQPQYQQYPHAPPNRAPPARRGCGQSHRGKQ